MLATCEYDMGLQWEWPLATDHHIKPTIGTTKIQELSQRLVLFSSHQGGEYSLATCKLIPNRSYLV